MLVPLVKVDQKGIAQRFVDYLQSLEVSAALKEHEQSYWVFCQEDKVDIARDEFNAFALQPYHPKYQIKPSSLEGEQCTSNTSPFQGLLEKFFAQAGFLTLTVFGLCWVVFLLAQFGFAYQIFNALKFYSSPSLNTLFTEPQRLLGPAFFHFSWLHIVFNTIWWWQLGGGIEKAFGKGTLLSVFLISAILSNVGQFIASGDNFGGLSGVVYATVGFVWWAGRLMPEKGIMLPNSIVGFMLIWLVLGMVDILPVNVANTAHTLGLISGCLAAWWISKTSKQQASK